MNLTQLADDPLQPFGTIWPIPVLSAVRVGDDTDLHARGNAIARPGRARPLPNSLELQL
jgi:hypothetical protein